MRALLLQRLGMVLGCVWAVWSPETPQRSMRAWRPDSCVCTLFNSANHAGTTCPLLMNALTWHAGKNNVGQLGNGTAVSSYIATAVRAPAGVTGWIQVIAGWYHTCLLAY